MDFKLKKGFTLIELLVVVAIIGILSVIISVSTSNPRYKADAAKVTSDLFQMMTAMEMAVSEGAILTEWPATVIGPACPAADADTIASDTLIYLRLRCPPTGYIYTIDGIVDGTNYSGYIFSATFSDGGTYTCAWGACSCDPSGSCQQ